MRTRHHERGQVLAIFAGGMIGLLAIAALAIDLSSAYSTRQTEKAAADAAALAGAQDLPMTGTPSSAVATRARLEALTDLAGRFGVPVPNCPTSVNITNCALSGTPYLVSISTPSKTTGSSQSLQVSVDNPTLQLSFASLFGKGTCAALRPDFCRQTSVATNDRPHFYALLTLRPPATGSTSDVKDIAINGGTTVRIKNGDVGSNANMQYDGSGSVLQLQSGYGMYYYDPFNGPIWGSDPPGTKLGSLIQDPQYVIPSEVSSPKPPTGGLYADNACVATAQSLLSDPFYGPLVPLDKGAPDPKHLMCFKKGQYSTGTGPTVGNGDLGILEPGLYFFDKGLTVQGTLIGGYTPGRPGVALVFNEGTNVFVANGTSGQIFLNAGAKLEPTAGAQAAPAKDYSGNDIVTNTSPPALMTLMVQPDLSCEGSGRAITLPIPASCTMPETKRAAVQLTGTSKLYLAGVQYGPTDNMSLNASSANGYVGQIIAWTVKYSGGTIIDQEGLAQPKNGVLRLTDDCSGPGTACSAP